MKVRRGVAVRYPPVRARLRAHLYSSLPSDFTTEFAQELVKRGADVIARDNLGLTPFQGLSLEEFRDIMQPLWVGPMEP